MQPLTASHSTELEGEEKAGALIAPAFESLRRKLMSPRDRGPLLQWSYGLINPALVL